MIWKNVFFLTLIFWGCASFALNEGTQTVTLDGVLFRKGTTSPLTDSSVQMKVQILNPAGTCLLYEETQTVNTAVSKGYFSIQVGSALANVKRGVSDPGNLMARVFQNTAAIPANDISTGSCPGNSYVPAAGDVRYFRVTVKPSGTGLADTLSPDIVMDSVPQALVAQSVQGLERAHILAANTSGTVSLDQTNLESLFTGSAWTNLQSILSANFLRTDSSGATLPSYASTPAGVSIGDMWFDSTTNEIKYQTNSGVQIVGSAGAVSGNSITSGTISGSTAMNVTGAITTSNSVTGSTITGTNVQATNLRIYNGSQYAQLTAQPMSANYSLALPPADGISGQVMATNGAGVLSWMTPSSGISGALSIAQGGTAVSSFTANRIIASNGTGTALLSFSCSLNQVISFDATGAAQCTNISSIYAGIQNGGNTTGAAISLGTNDNFALQIKTNNSVALTISQNGNMGLGVNNPQAKLEVSGEISISHPTNSSLIIGDTSGNSRGNRNIEIQSGRSLANQVAAGDDSVLIGRSNRGTANGVLVIGSGNQAGNNTNSIAIGANNNSNMGGVSFGRGNTTSNASGIAIGDGNTASAANTVAIGFSVNNSTANTVQIGVSDASKLTLNSLGNLGLGVTNPSEKLEVSGGIKIGNTGTTNAGTIRWDGTNFYGYTGSAWQAFVPNPPASGACDTTVSYTSAGTYAYTVPASFGTITIKLWGGGGSGGNAASNNVGAPGAASSILSLGLNAGGGGAGMNGTGIASSAGAGGVATGGSINVNGSAGTIPGGGFGGAGGSSPSGGAGGAARNTTGTGLAGASPGGGGGAATYSGGPSHGAGGGGGAYVEKTYSFGSLIPGSTIADVVVGSGGLFSSIDGYWGGSGAVGRVSISCSSTGTPVTNDRSLAFYSAGSFSSAPDLVFSAAGNVGIGISQPRSALDVQSGSITGRPAVSNGTSVVDFGTGNIQYTSANCGSFALHNLKDGGSYTFIVQGTTAATCSFTAFSDAGVSPLTVKLPPDHGATIASKHTIYNFIVGGAYVYVAWTPGY